MQPTCEKFEQWGNGFISLMLSLMVLWVVGGILLTRSSGALPPLIFAGLVLGTTFYAFHATCRYCYYYGKKCYLMIGLIVPYFYKKVDEPAPKSNMLLWVVTLLAAILYPIIVVFLEQNLVRSVLYSLTYLVAPVAALLLVSRYSCPHCKHTSCISNPDRKKQTATP